MHNPLALLSRQLLDRLIKGGNLYFVRQFYPRGIDHFENGLKGVFLFSYYSNKEVAEKHLKSLGHDDTADLYDATIPAEKERLYIAGSQPAGYHIYVSLLKAKEWEPTPELIPKIKRYISTRTGWKPGRGATVDIDIFIEFGELFIKLTKGTDKIKVKLADIERF